MSTDKEATTASLSGTIFTEKDINQDEPKRDIIKANFEIEIHINREDLENKSVTLKNDLIRIQNCLEKDMENCKNDDDDVTVIDEKYTNNQKESNSDELNVEDLNFHEVFDTFFKQYKMDTAEKKPGDTFTSSSKDNEIIPIEIIQDDDQPSAKRCKLDNSKNIEETNNETLLENDKEKETDKVKVAEQSLDDSVCFLSEQAPDKSKRSVYETDTVTDEKDVLRRWRIKNVTNAKKNLSITNYRLRLYNDKNARQPTDRRFKPCLFEHPTNTNNRSDNSNSISLLNEIQQIPPLMSSFNGRFVSNKKNNNASIYTDFSLKPSKTPVQNQKKSKSNSPEKSDAVKDKMFLNNCIYEIRTANKQLIEEVNARYLGAKQNLDELYQQQEFLLKYYFDQQIQFGMNCFVLQAEIAAKLVVLQTVYQGNLSKLINDFDCELKELKRTCNEQINGLKELHKSGNYEKGKLNQYSIKTLIQPAAVRRKYNDNGFRQVLLSEDQLRKILIEDEIYLYYYGEPV